MHLEAGTRLGAYEILSPLGEGGMGQVYKARDTRLDRTVAIKVLSPLVAGDDEFRARFEREARAISQLQHPHICALFDIGSEGGTEYLVLEYLEGETLAERLQRGAVPLADALKIAIQISDALDKAHRLNIVHRDLKPGNVMLTKTGAKLLDFGLAKSAATPVSVSGSGDLSAAVTRTTPLTGHGTILGTFQYMAPEQIEGADTDARSDIWAFGCVLHETLTGRRTFEGRTRAGLIGAILKDEVPPVSRQVRLASAALDHVVATCLAKDPDERWQSAADVTRELTWIAVSKADATASPAGRVSRARERLAWMAGLVVTALAVWLAGPFGRPASLADAPVTRSVIALDDGLEVAARDDSAFPGPVLAPDGRFLAYAATDVPRLAIRDMATGETRLLPDVDSVQEIFFSPDGRQLGYIARSAIWRMSVGGGEPVMVAEGVPGLSYATRGAAWGDDGYIYYTPYYAAGLWRISATHGGPPEELTTLDADQAEKSHRYPAVLPGSRAVLFVVATARHTTFDDATIEVLDLDTGTRRRLIDRGAAPSYSPTGHLLYTRGSALVAVGFDLQTLETRGDPVVVVEDVRTHPSFGRADVSLSTSGALVTVRPRPPVPSEFVAAGRDGRAETIGQAVGTFPDGRVSPDGTRLALWKIGATSQMSILDLQSGRLSPLTFEWDNEEPLWTVDGTRLVASSNMGGGVTNLFLFSASSADPPVRLTTSPNIQRLGWRSSPGNDVPFTESDPATGLDIWTVSLEDGSLRRAVQTPFDESEPALSPDGRWLVYVSTQSGEPEVVVQAYPDGGRTWVVSRGSGTEPLWHPNGREVIYRDGAAVVSVPFRAGSTFEAGAPVTLFDWTGQLFDVLEDGRFLMRRRDLPPPVAELDLVANWFGELQQKMADVAR